MSDIRVKTKKKVKRRLKIKGVLFLMGVLALIYFGIKFIMNKQIASIIVNGNNYLKGSEIIKESNLTENTKFFTFNSKKICNALSENNPLIDTCSIDRKTNFDVVINIQENTPLFYYASESSVVLSDKSRMSGNNFGVPTLVNFVPLEILDEFTTGLSEIKSDIIRSISEIEYVPSVGSDGVYIDKERFMLLMNDGNTIYINNRHLDTLNYYEKVYASLGNKKGVFNFDCDFGNYLFTEYGDE